LNPNEEIEIRVRPEELHNTPLHWKLLSKQWKSRSADIRQLMLVRRSVDARKEPVFVLKYRLSPGKKPAFPSISDFGYRDVSDRPEVMIAGCGPAGMFAALRLIELGFKPVIIERGKEIRERRRDLALLNRQGIVNPDSNYCFGEGGAGTFSDGKLFTRSTKKGDVLRILNIFAAHGASPDILIDAHPHIGTNRLPKIIENMRKTILGCGGEIMFGRKLVNAGTEGSEIQFVEFEDGRRRKTQSLILATGHSARDIFELFVRNKWDIESKGFAVGVRVEHPQTLIDSIQYHVSKRNPNLPAAAYSWVRQINGRGVYSFCMCPGGIICPAATNEGEIVVNGWSPSRRNSPYANSGVVVEVKPEDLSFYRKDGPMAGIRFQEMLEKRAFEAGGGGQKAPAQSLTDFTEAKVSSEEGQRLNRKLKTSYVPGITSSPLHEIFPRWIYDRLKLGFVEQGRLMKGYHTEGAIVLGVESRTSSPVKIPRDPVSLQHPQIGGLFPCGEGAGYAGGIMSAAIDGENCAARCAEYMNIKR